MAMMVVMMVMVPVHCVRAFQSPRGLREGQHGEAREKRGD
jgi:hypothetical protein